MSKRLVAVYGTLKKGKHNHRYYMHNAEYLGEARTSTDYTLIVDRLPYMVERPSERGVVCEIYSVTRKELISLDYLEGHPDFYQRKTIEVTTDNGEKIEVEAYIHPDIFGTDVEIRESF